MAKFKDSKKADTIIVAKKSIKSKLKRQQTNINSILIIFLIIYVILTSYFR